MVASSAKEATNNAKSYTTCLRGYCLKYVRTWLEIGSRYPSAISAWDNAQKRHTDRNPPPGVPVFYRGGNYGHIVLSLNNRKSDGKQLIRSTDAPSSNRVSTQTIDWCEDYWNYPYLGWTEDLNGIMIPYAGKDDKPKESKWSKGDVWVSKLHKGQKNSDSVSRLCYRLMHHNDMPKSHKPPQQKADYFEELLEAVRFWQKNLAPKGTKGPTDGTSVSNQQANKLFGDNYNVIEE